VYVKGGTLEVAAPGALAVKGAYSQAAGTLKLVLSGSGKGVLTVGGKAVLAGGSLAVSFAGYKPQVGDTLDVLTAQARSGQFANVSVSGASKVTTTYTATGVQIRIDAI